MEKKELVYRVYYKHSPAMVTEPPDLVGTYQTWREAARAAAETLGVHNLRGLARAAAETLGVHNLRGLARADSRDGVVYWQPVYGRGRDYHHDVPYVEICHEPTEYGEDDEAADLWG